MEGHNVTDLYKECLRNHAASIGSYATDGCGEFTLDSSASSSPPTLHCAACGCHRNFHRKVTYSREETTKVMEMIEYGGDRRAVMMMESGRKKRFRSKFTMEQKEKMLTFAEKLGWKLQRSRDEEDEVEKFCRGIGVSRQVFKQDTARKGGLLRRFLNVGKGN
ncbi:hypothetical protein K2173_027114 [Erythroxylum novogranatense]|uniref:ZF-HD dimerization-type domain-containing protein n=1 Tax=Erythroxylum novogranatense TaxID=1862640 RepID=A0AAV8TY37_9ROSI|nr:hypothetical protein K2173_027114 [Erythroxylum novogranatense]